MGDEGYSHPEWEAGKHADIVGEEGLCPPDCRVCGSGHRKAIFEPNGLTATAMN